MSDQKKGLPVRSEGDVDQKVQVKIVDATTPSQAAEVSPDSHLAVYNDGVYNVATNVDPSNTGVIGHTRNATPGDVQQIERITAANPDSDDIDPANIHAMDVNTFLHGFDGTNWDRITSSGGALDVNLVSQDIPINVNIDGIYDGVTNTDPDNVGAIYHVRNATPGDAQQTFRSTGATPTSDALDGTTVQALDVNSFGMAWDGSGWDRIQKDPTSEGLLIHWAGQTVNVDVNLNDESGDPYSISNPLPVVITDGTGGGDDVQDYDDNALVDVGIGSTDNHDYTVTAGKVFILKQWSGAASSRGKWELQIETGVGAGTYDTKATWFTTESNPSFEIKLAEPINVAAGVIARIARTNRDSEDTQCMYSWLNGEEI